MHEHKHDRHEHKEGAGPGYKGISDDERRKMMDPDVILPKIGLKTGMTFVDVGCGQGFFALPAARIVGSRGHVICIDIDKEALEVLRHRASDERLNIQIIDGDAGNTFVCEGCADIVFFGICMHDLAESKKVLANAWRMLKPGGILVDLDGNTDGAEGAHQPGKRLNKKDASRLIKEAHFNTMSIEDFSDWL